MNIDVILFDWGGTLSQVARQDDSLRRGLAAAARMLCRPGVDGVLESLLETARGLEKSAAAHPEHREADLADVLAQWANTHVRGPGDEPLAAGSEPVQAAVEAIGRAWVGSLDPLPESAETLRTLRSRGYRMGLVSNCMIPRAYCLEELDRQGFGGLLDFHVFSSEVGYRKPSPRIYEAALARAYPQGRPEDLSRVLFVGDSPAFDVIAPAAMGMKTALIECHKGLWPAEDYATARPDLTLASVAELIERL